METEYYKKYQLEFDDVIEGEFNEYRLEIHKRLFYADATGVEYSSEFTDSSGWTTAAAAISAGDLSITSSGGFAFRSITVTEGSYYISTNITANVTGFTVDFEDASGTSMATYELSTTGVASSPIFYVPDGTYRLTISSNGAGTNIMDYVYLYSFDNEVSQSIQGTGTPLVINYENTGDDVLSPIRSSSVDINFYQTESTQDYSELFTPEDLDFKVFIYKNDVLYWQGWLYPSLVSISSSSTPINISLRAYDGIHLIKNINYFATDLNSIRSSPDATDRFDYQSLLNTLTKCLYNTGVDNNYYFQCRLKNEDVAGAAYTDFFTHTRTYHRTWIEDQVSMTCFEVLEHICNDIGLSVYQRNGNWVVNKISDLAFSQSGETAKVVTSVSSTTQLPLTISNVSGDNYVQSTSFVNIDGASIIYQYATSEVTVNHDHDQNFMVGDFTADEVIDTSSNGFQYWKSRDNTYAEEVVVIKNTTNDTDSGDNTGNEVFTEINLKIDPIDNVNAFFSYIYTGNDLTNTLVYQPYKYRSVPFQKTFSMSMSVRPLVGYDAGNRAIVGSSIQQYASGDEVWSNQISAYEEGGLEGFAITFNVDKNDETVVSPNQWSEISYVTPIVTNTTGVSSVVDHDFCFRFHGSVLFRNVDPGDGHIDGTIFYDTSLQDVRIAPTVGGVKQLVISEASYVLKTSSSYSYKYDDIEVHAGSNIVSNGSKAYLSYDASSGNLESIAEVSWDVWTDGVAESMTIQHSRALARMLLSFKPSRRLEGTHYGNYTFGNLFNYETASGVSSGKFFPLSCNIDLRNARTQFSADEILRSGQTGSIVNGSLTKEIVWRDDNNNSFVETL